MRPCDLICHHGITTNTQHLNSLVPGRFQFNFRQVIFRLNLVNGGWGISSEIAIRWMPLDLTDDKSTLVRVMAWCRQATSHYLGQFLPRSRSPYGVTRPQWVNYHREIYTKCMPRIALCMMEQCNKTWGFRMQQWYWKPSDMYKTILLYE